MNLSDEFDSSVFSEIYFDANESYKDAENLLLQFDEIDFESLDLDLEEVCIALNQALNRFY